MCPLDNPVFRLNRIRQRGSVEVMFPVYLFFLCKDGRKCKENSAKEKLKLGKKKRKGEKKKEKPYFLFFFSPG